MGVHLLAYDRVNATVFAATGVEDYPEEQRFHVIEN
jgi:hypothetical protein